MSKEEQLTLPPVLEADEDPKNIEKNRYRKTRFVTKIRGVKLEVYGAVYNGEIDEFTVFIGDVIVNDILDERVVDKLHKKVLKNTLDNN